MRTKTLPKIGENTTLLQFTIFKYIFFFFFLQMSESWSYPPLNDTAEAANRVHEALVDRGWRLRP